MKKRLVSLAMALVIFVFAFTGCSSSTQSETPVESETPVSQTTDASPADEWPSGPVQVIVGAGAGGGIDTAARLIAKYMEKELGESFVVTNTTGGAGSIAATDVKNSTPDGYKFLVAHEAILTNKIAGTTDFDYDGFAVGGVPFQVYTTCLLSAKYESLDDLIAAAKANPGTIKFGTELATNDTAIVAMLEEANDVQFQLVDSGAVSDQIASMLGEHIDYMKAPVGVVQDYVKSGDVNIIGFFNENRYPLYPDVPTMNEQGIDFIVDKFFGTFFPKETDPAILAKFAETLKKVCEDPEFQAEAANVLYDVAYVSPEDAPAYFEDCKVRLAEYQELLETHYAID